MTWQIRAIDARSQRRMGVLKDVSKRRFDFLLDAASRAAFELPLVGSDPIRDRFRGGQSEFLVERDGEPIETVFSFTNPNINSGDGDEDPSLGCVGIGIASYLQDALVYGQSAQYSGTELGWDWIEAFEARAAVDGGDYGFTQGPVEGTPPTRYKTAQQDAELWAMIQALGSSGAGFDYAIDTLRRYREYHPQRGSDRGLVLTYGGNVEWFAYDENAGPGDLVNAARVTGPVDGPAAKTASDTASIARYGRREAAIMYMADLEDAGVTDSQLQNYADAAVVDHAAPSIIPGVRLNPDDASVAWGTYWLGDTVTFRANLASYVEIDAQYRIIGVHVVVDEDENETVSLTLNRVGA